MPREKLRPCAFQTGSMRGRLGRRRPPDAASQARTQRSASAPRQNCRREGNTTEHPRSPPARGSEHSRSPPARGSARASREPKRRRARPSGCRVQTQECPNAGSRSAAPTASAVAFSRRDGSWDSRAQDRPTNPRKVPPVSRGAPVFHAGLEAVARWWKGTFRPHPTSHPARRVTATTCALRTRSVQVPERSEKPKALPRAGGARGSGRSWGARGVRPPRHRAQLAFRGGPRIVPPDACAGAPGPPDPAPGSARRPARLP